MDEFVFVFDVDDTLFLERDYVRSGFQSAGRVVEEHFGVAGAGDFAWALFEDGVRGTTFNRLIERFGLPDTALAMLIDAYRSHEPNIALEPDARSFLERLPDWVVGTAIITDGYGPGQWKKIRALGLTSRIDEIIVTAERGEGWEKPNDRSFRAVEHRFSDSRARFVYFADNPAKDFVSPTRLEWMSVRIRRELGLHRDVADQQGMNHTFDAFPAELEWLHE